MGFPVPQGTFLQNVLRGIVIPIKNHATAMADVGAHRERLQYPRAALRTILTRELWSHRNDRDIMHGSIGIHPR